MPTNRTRRARTWGGVVERYRAEMLRDGPEDMLLAGVGYMQGEGGAIFAILDEAGQERVLAKMRADWDRHGSELVAGWRAAGLTSATNLSWAERTFGLAGAT